MLWYINPFPPLRKARKVKTTTRKPVRRTPASASKAILSGKRVTITQGRKSGTVSVRVNPRGEPFIGPRERMTQEDMLKWREAKKAYRRRHPVKAKKNPGRRHSMKKLFGAAAKAHAKRMAKLHRRRGRRVRRNPAEGYFSTAAQAARKTARRKKFAGVMKTYGAKPKRRGRVKAAAKKVYSSFGRGYAAFKRRASKTRAAFASAAKAYGAKVKRRRAAAKKASTPKRKSSPKRKPAARPARKTGGGKMTKRARAAAARKGWRNRRKGGSAPRRRRGRKGPNWLLRYSHALKSRRPKGGTARKLRAARITVLRARAGKFRKQRAWAKSYASKHRMHTNPKNTMKAVVSALKDVLPVAASFIGTKYGTRQLADLLTSRVSALSGYNIDTGVALGIVAAAHIATVKVGALRKYRTGVMVGAGLNALTTAIKQFAPDTSKMLGLGDADGVYDNALMGYGDVGDYVETSAYEDIGDYVATEDYVETGTDDDLGAYEDVGSACGAYEDLGAVARKMVRRAPVRRALAAPAGSRAIPRAASAKQIPEWTDEPLESFYTGIFSGGYGG